MSILLVNKSSTGIQILTSESKIVLTKLKTFQTELVSLDYALVHIYYKLNLAEELKHQHRLPNRKFARCAKFRQQKRSGEYISFLEHLQL